MKFVNKGLAGPQTVWVLTDQQLFSLEKAGIGFDQLSKLPLHLDQMSEQDVVDIAVTQYRAALKLGVVLEPKEVFEQFNDDYKDILSSKIKTEQDRLSKVEHLKEFTNYSKFYVQNTNGMLVLVIADPQVSMNYIGELCASFTELHVGTYTEAMLKAVYLVNGYLYLHNKDSVPALPSESFSLATLYRALVS
ncbi:hypothetical protein [Vibrio phage pTD1]|uniref:Uncharacterized protein n=1 Tax=Vibrio phage pTD1 TaxID=1938577 RepID=A0A1Q2U2T1_9CAUD|nr:hypothetical protein FDH33_gp066 [Vibrio phage pTD1]BAW98275.1 hypothetical protein [Vibrio phage pTD1]